MAIRTGTTVNASPSFAFYPRNRGVGTTTGPDAGGWSYFFNAGWEYNPNFVRRPMLIPVYQSTAITIPIQLLDGATGLGRAGITSASVVTRLKKSGATSFSTISPVSFIDTGNGWYDLGLSSANTDTLGLAVLRVTAPSANPGQLSALPFEVQLNVQAVNLYDRSQGQFVIGTVVSDSGNSQTQFVTNLTQTAADHWKNAFATFTSGALKEQTQQVSSYGGSTKTLMFKTPGYTGIPSPGDTFILVNQ